MFKTMLDLLSDNTKPSTFPVHLLNLLDKLQSNETAPPVDATPVEKTFTKEELLALCLGFSCVNLAQREMLAQSLKELEQVKLKLEELKEGEYLHFQNEGREKAYIERIAILEAMNYNIKEGSPSFR